MLEPAARPRPRAVEGCCGARSCGGKRARSWGHVADAPPVAGHVDAGLGVEEGALADADDPAPGPAQPRDSTRAPSSCRPPTGRTGRPPARRCARASRGTKPPWCRAKVEGDGDGRSGAWSPAVPKTARAGRARTAHPAGARRRRRAFGSSRSRRQAARCSAGARRRGRAFGSSWCRRQAARCSAGAGRRRRAFRSSRCRRQAARCTTSRFDASRAPKAMAADTASIMPRRRRPGRSRCRCRWPPRWSACRAGRRPP